MSIEKELHDRSGSVCELCSGNEGLGPYHVKPAPDKIDNYILACHACLEQLNDITKINPDHWRCLNNSMWSSVPAVQVMAWRLLNLLKNEGWPQELLDILYLDDETLTWAKAETLADNISTEEKVVHRDSNGNVLQAGDTVVLIKDLDVKGAGFTAKRGTAVRGISLVENNSAQIEGKVNGQQIVILTQYVKKS
jgi:protein PhnA